MNCVVESIVVYYLLEKRGVQMVERNVYKVNKSGMLQVTIPAVVAKMWGISDITRVCIREMAPGMWKVWAPEVSDKGVTVVDNTEAEVTK